jgi:hypothetical protein
MNKLFRVFLASRRKRRSNLVGVALWLVRMVRDVENDELSRKSDLLDRLDDEGEWISCREYIAAEDEYIICEYSMGFLDCAITDLEYAY